MTKTLYTQVFITILLDDLYTGIVVADRLCAFNISYNELYAILFKRSVALKANRHYRCGLGGTHEESLEPSSYDTLE